MTSPPSRPPTPTYLVAHPGAEMFGSDRMVLESVHGLLADGARVVVAVPDDGPLVEMLRGAGAEVVIAPMLVLRKALLRPRNWVRLVTASARGAVAAWRLASRLRPAAVYVSTVTIPQYPLIARLRSIPVVTHIHEAEASGSRLSNLALYLPQLAARRILVNSDFSARTIDAFLPLLARRVIVVRNGIAGPPAGARPPRDRIDDGIRVLYVGRLSPRKGVEDAVEAVEILRSRGREASLSLLGSVFTGYEWFESALRERADAGGADVRFLGFAADIWPVIADHDVLVVPSRLDEPFGNTAVEGLLAERPVIATTTGGLVEAVDGYATAWLTPPSDPAALAESLSTVLDGWERITRQTSTSRSRAALRHDPDVYRRSVAREVRHTAAGGRFSPGRLSSRRA